MTFQVIQGAMIASTLRTDDDDEHPSFMPAGLCFKLAFITNAGSIALGAMISVLLEWLANLCDQICGCGCIVDCIRAIVDVRPHTPKSTTLISDRRSATSSCCTRY
jgi:hypothetical protein